MRRYSLGNTHRQRPMRVHDGCRVWQEADTSSQRRGARKRRRFFGNLAVRLEKSATLQRLSVLGSANAQDQARP